MTPFGCSSTTSGGRRCATWGVLTAYFAVNTSSKEFPVLQRLIRLKKNLTGKEAQLQDPTFATKALL